jgi:hypothetical protein
LSLYYATGLGQATRARGIVLSLRLGHGFFTKRMVAELRKRGHKI